MALTYDDGPDPIGTPAVLDALAATGTRATFFQLVERAERYPDLVRRVLDEGHEVGLHGIDHQRLTEVSPHEVARLVRTGRERLEAVTGRPTRWFRPPYGSQSLRTYLSIRRQGLEVVVWGPTAEDWRDGSATEVADRALRGISSGAVLLMHDGFEVPALDPTPPPTFDRGDVARALVDGLERRGFSGTSVGDLVDGARPWRTAWFRP